MLRSYKMLELQGNNKFQTMRSLTLTSILSNKKNKIITSQEHFLTDPLFVLSKYLWHSLEQNCSYTILQHAQSD